MLVGYFLVLYLSFILFYFNYVMLVTIKYIISIRCSVPRFIGVDLKEITQVLSCK